MPNLHLVAARRPADARAAPRPRGATALGWSISLWLFARRLTPARRAELAGYLAALSQAPAQRRRRRPKTVRSR